MTLPVITMDIFDQSKEMLSRIYDTIRIINPYKRKLVEYKGKNIVEESNFHCYDFWNNNTICSNCISMKAFSEKEVVFKLECKGSSIYMVSAVPIQSGDEIYILELYKDVSKNIIVDENYLSDSELLNMLGKLNQLQVKDSLTGLFNRRYIDERLPIDMVNSISESIPLSIILADIDRFKSINDTYGHIAGDYVLKEFAGILSECIGKDVNWVSRYGGEEFLAVLLGSHIETADNIAEHMRKSVEDKDFLFNHTKIKITSSFGVATILPGTCTTPEKLIDTADKHLYMAKNNGRNRVISGVFIP